MSWVAVVFLLPFSTESLSYSFTNSHSNILTIAFIITTRLTIKKFSERRIKKRLRSWALLLLLFRFFSALLDKNSQLNKTECCLVVAEKLKKGRWKKLNKVCLIVFFWVFSFHTLVESKKHIQTEEEGKIYFFKDLFSSVLYRRC